MTTKRSNILYEADSIVNGERNSSYGDPYDHEARVEVEIREGE